MSILKHVSLPALSGKQTGVVKDYQEVSNDKGGYLKVNFQLADRVYPYLIFPGTEGAEGKQINYFCGAVRRQLNLEGSVTLEEILEVAKTTPIDMFFSYDKVHGRLNVAFHETTQPESVDLNEVQA